MEGGRKKAIGCPSAQQKRRNAQPDACDSSLQQLWCQEYGMPRALSGYSHGTRSGVDELMIIICQNKDDQVNKNIIRRTSHDQDVGFSALDMAHALSDDDDGPWLLGVGKACPPS